MPEFVLKKPGLLVVFLTVNIHDEVERFRAFKQEDLIEVIGPDIIKFSSCHPLKSDKLKIGFLALIHGNEGIGLPILNTLIQGLVDGLIQTEHEIYFGLGNLPAAYAGKRFLEKDLNRCFGQALTECEEDRRARELEKSLLNRVDYLVDLHQTIQPAISPFFIFQYTGKTCFSHLAMMNTKFPAILQFDAIGDMNQGLSTDEYVRSKGRFGTALELGQIGYSHEKFNAGISVCARLLEKLKSVSRFEQVHVPFTGRIPFELYQITGRHPAPEDGISLNAEIQNFARVEKGQVIGKTSAGVFRSEYAGFALFPKLNQDVAKGQNLFFVCDILKAENLLTSQRAAETEQIS